MSALCSSNTAVCSEVWMAEGCTAHILEKVESFL